MSSILGIQRKCARTQHLCKWPFGSKLGEYNDDEDEEKPIGALILAMQAVSCLLHSIMKLMVSGWPCT